MTNLKSSKRSDPLTDAEREILALLVNERLTVAQASRRRGCTPQAIYNIRRRLKDKGFLRASKGLVEKTDRGYKPLKASSDDWRLHALEFVVRILEGHRSDKYLFARGDKGQNTVLDVRGSSVLLYRDKVHVRISHSFVSDSPERAMWDATEHLRRVLSILENDLGLILLKDRATNIQLVKGECAHMGDLMAVQSKSAGLRVYDRDTKKPRWRIDFSGGMPELEALEPSKQVQDAEMYKRLLDDISHNEHLPLSELSSLVGSNVQQLSQVIAVLNTTVRVQKSIIDLLGSQISGFSSSLNDSEENRGFPDYVG